MGINFSKIKSFIMNRLLSTSKIIQKTIQLTSKIKVRYPELYKFLDETPLLVSSINDTQIHRADFAKYFETLKAQMKFQDKTHIKIKQAN